MMVFCILFMAFFYRAQWNHFFVQCLGDFEMNTRIRQLYAYMPMYHFSRFIFAKITMVPSRSRHSMPCHVMSYHAMSYHVMSHHVVTSKTNHVMMLIILSRLVLSCVVLSCLVFSHLVLSPIAISCHVLLSHLSGLSCRVNSLVIGKPQGKQEPLWVIEAELLWSPRALGSINSIVRLFLSRKTP